MASVDHTRSLSAHQIDGPQAEVAKNSRLVLAIFLICILMPIAKEVAGLRMSPSRLFLLMAAVPLAVQCLGGKFGRVTLVDWLMVFHGLWIFISLIAVHGTSVMPFAGITMVELTGGYFVGRAYVRNSDDYRFIFKFLLIALIINIPLALVENLTAKLIIPDLLRPVFETPTRDYSARGRIGLERVQGVFDHPILWGMFCSLTFANFIMSLRGSNAMRLAAIILSMWSTMISLSSGPMLALLLQTCLLLWGRITNGRWLLCLILAISGYVVIDLVSDRTPIRILISYAAFNSLSAYTRLAQFDWGLMTIQNNPLFGIGLNDWVRPNWVGGSVDNFWLLTGMRYGAAAFFSIFGAFVVHLWFGAHAKLADPENKRLRVGHLVALIAMSFVLITVHIWGNVSIFVVFYIGAGAWIYTSPHLAAEEVDTEEVDTKERDIDATGGTARRDAGLTYTRFAHTKSRRQSDDQDEIGSDDDTGVLRRSRGKFETPTRKHIAAGAETTHARPRDGELWARDFSDEKRRD